MRSITVTVTKRHIEAARSARIRHEPRSNTCPIAQAFRPMFPRSSVSVGLSEVHVRGKNRERVYRLPQEAMDLIIRFDDHKPVKPVTFKTKGAKCRPITH